MPKVNGDGGIMLPPTKPEAHRILTKNKDIEYSIWDGDTQTVPTDADDDSFLPNILDNVENINNE